MGRPTPADWHRLEPLVDALLDASPRERPALLERLSHGDTVQKAELARLVEQCEQADPILDRPVADAFASVFRAESPPMPEVLAGRYRILHEVGRGGMAIVYRARDLRHGRDVAVKVVRPELAATLGRARFLREIEIAARLRHPNIVPLYDSGEVGAATGDAGDDDDRPDAGGSLLYYVMPYEEGHSLRERLEQSGRLPVGDAVRILHDVCEALAHAHRHGIVHRDIKPENVLLAGRQAMIADFGIAHAMSEATTDATPATAGIAFGTPAYMAPEQAAGDPDVDHRADIHAIGLLGYELLAGVLPFDGNSRNAKIPVPLARRRRDVPDALSDVIMKCLATRPADRWQSAEALLAQLEAAVDAAPRHGHRRTIAIAGAALAAAAVIGIVLSLQARPDRAPLVLGRARQVTAEPGLEVQPSLSPDGRHVAYAAGNSLQMRILVRALGGGKPVPLTPDSATNAWQPRWSPDGTRILFLASGGVWSAAAVGGDVRQEIESRAGDIVRSAAWSPDGREIAYVRGDSLLARAVGAQRTRTIATGADLHSCSWSGDGARLACVSGNSFYVTVGTDFGAGPMFANLAPSRIVIVPAASGAPVAVTDSSSLHQSPVWSGDAKTLFYVSNRDGPRDVYTIDVGGRGSVQGEPVRVTTGIGAHSIAFAADGTRMLYAAYASSANVWSMPIPSGPSTSPAAAVALTTGNQTVEGVRVSPDGRWVVYDSDLSGNSDIYRVPVGGGDPERLTHGALDEFRGALSPAGTELVYHAFATGARNLFLLPLGGGVATQLTRSEGQRSMANWSPDGTALALFDIDQARVLVMRRDRRGAWGPARFTGGRGWRPEWSPDGRTIAFVSPADGRIGVVTADSSAQRDVYVPGPGDPLAELAIFSADGRSLYFKSHDKRGRASFWSVPVSGGRPRLLTRLEDPAWQSNRFEFPSDGLRFYFTVEDRQSDIWVAEVGR